MNLSVSVIIPCYNVAPTIESVVTNVYLIAQKSKQSVEVIAVNDGSTDDTPAILRRLAKKHPSLRVINHVVNQGYGKTIRELYYAASNDWIFSFPGDGQFNADEIHMLIPYSGRADMILGWRKERNDPENRKIQSRVYNALINLFFRTGLHDVNTIRLMKRSFVRSVALTSTSAFVDAELAIRARRGGFTVVEVPIHHNHRHDHGATGGKFFKTILPTVIDMLRLRLTS